VKLELKGITKRYGSLVANDHIDLTVEQGQIHALLGENGAGKTTLMNVLYGLVRPDEGEILIDGQPQHFGSPGDAIRAGIGMVHQHFMLVPVFTVAENVTLGMERTRVLGLLDRRRMRRDVRELSERYGLEVDPDALVEDLPVGVQQRVEIVKALMRDASVLILDEPTSVLTPLETEELFRIMRDLRAGGRSLVFISHKLKEVQEIADTITVIRRGRVVGERPPTTSDAELASLMVGRSVQLRVTKPPASPGDVRLDVQGLTVANEQGKSGLDEVSFQVRAGEILGVAGVQGNGQTELCEALLGLVPAAAGAVWLEGQDLTHATPRQRLHSGIGYIPEDRQEDGLVAGFSVGENLMLDVYNEPPYSSGIALDLGTINRTAAERVADFDIRTTSTATSVGTLSGGNQQKVILAREIGREVRLLVASQPTRGLDVGSIEFVHRRIVEQRDQGLGVLLISSELDEIYALSDRIAVMYEGKITGFRDPDVPAEELGMLMAGATDADAAASGAAARQGRIAGGEAADETGLMEAGLLGVGLPGAAGDGRGPGDGGPPAGDGPGGDGSAGGGGSGPADDSGADPE
jgi:simple sugar transport system ATP-binding protein